MSSSGGSAKRKAAKDQPKEEVSEAAAHKDSTGGSKKPRHVNAAAQHLMCAITQELPIEPVTAEDGFLYEEREIKMWIKKKGNSVTSPQTNAPMGKKLFPAIQVRNAITELVESGAVVGELAENWNESMENKKTVEETKRKAEEGDTDAMTDLGEWYRKSEMGLPEDMEQAYKWYKKAADLIDTNGLVSAGVCLAYGLGVARSVADGVALTCIAAGRGDATGCCNLADYYRSGRFLTKNKGLAKYWYKMALENNDEDLTEDRLAHSQERLRELENEE